MPELSTLFPPAWRFPRAIWALLGRPSLNSICDDLRRQFLTVVRPKISRLTRFFAKRAAKARQREPTSHGERGDTGEPAPRREGQSAYRPRPLALPRGLPLRRGAQRSHAGSPRKPAKPRLKACIPGSSCNSDPHSPLIAPPAPDVSIAPNPASAPRLHQCSCNDSRKKPVVLQLIPPQEDGREQPLPPKPAANDVSLTEQ